tara:strand:- start:296 stop:580 length:285 start_codon:yes stop_codon:yes gene_type:complete
MNRYVIAAMITTLVIVNVILYYTIVKSEEVIDPTEQIEIIQLQIDTVEIEKVKTIIRYKTKTINEIIYINTSNDTQQLIIRSQIRHNIDRSLQK